jgi:hypothetical protein
MAMMMIANVMMMSKCDHDDYECDNDDVDDDDDSKM